MPLPVAQEPSSADRASTKIRIENPVSIPTKSQVCITGTSKQHGIHVVQPFDSLHEHHCLPLAKTIVLIELDVPFKVLVANLGTTTQWLVKNQVFDNTRHHSLAIFLTKIPVSDVFVLQDPQEEKKTPSTSAALLNLTLEGSEQTEPPRRNICEIMRTGGT